MVYYHCANNFVSSVNFGKRKHKKQGAPLSDKISNAALLFP